MFQGTPLIPGCWPAGTDGAAGAVIAGVNRLPPVGLTFFSVAGAGLAEGDVVAVVVVVVGDDGAWLPLPPHPAVRAAITMTTASARRPI